MAIATMKQILKTGTELVPDIDPHEKRVYELREELRTKVGFAEALVEYLNYSIEALDGRDSEWLESTLENVQANLENLK